ncbi:lytic transglycosylase domain-containing protein [Sinorhizobium alkalisoli]|uniref:Lytic transglycosylase n=1 Tax=Sinorhizobium alkalisoli TaxID=1752398 RepID=A0A1E3V3N3_9HYPH|nr:transglycosylase SLT domain-containing protein [Sinorhizobium alkalisoli]MCA1491645.1 transglycosylase SLT domain-containing protein [Ensifer sp. NBAIM29]MCG5482444.1 transglycosylase SLT domain-containing protein [Sinorhizobium meliloti]ODR88213.1 lytic transglycosylase [Sinorhizobium alkalisoli]QFI67060.1 Soluble lytic murein transglycosylase [Sinorhizobium alkalisoli]
MRISSVAAVAACIGMFVAGMGTSYAGGVDRTIKTSSLKSVTRTAGFPTPSLSPKSYYGDLIHSYAKQYGVAVDLARAVVEVESNFNAKARGRAGEIGLMQIKPATARMMGYSGSAKGLYDPETNIKFGMLYLAKAQELSDGSTCGTILKYNAGHGAKRMNPVSKAYCGKVKAILD